MRLIKPGRFTETPPTGQRPAWWVSRQGTCAVCGATVELAATDTPEREPGIPVDESVRVVFSCPEPHPSNRGAVVVWRYGAGGM
jgi:hypothetical protein